MATRNLADWRLILKRGRIPTQLGGLRGDIGTLFWNDWLDSLVTPGSDIPGLIVGIGGGLNNIVEDLTPQLGANLDMNAFDILAANSAGPAILDQASADDTPTLIPNRNDLTLGWGGQAGDITHTTSGFVITRFTSGGMEAENATGYQVRNNASGAASPTLVPDRSNAGSGFGGVSGSLAFITAGVNRFSLVTDSLQAANAAGPEILNVASNNSTPSLIPNRATNSGVGGTGAAVSLISNGSAVFTAGVGPGQVNCIHERASGLIIGSTSGSYGLHNVASSATVPTMLPTFLSEVAGIGGVSGAVSMIANSLERITCNATGIGFFATTPAARPTGVGVDAASIHAALVTLGLITA